MKTKTLFTAIALFITLFLSATDQKYFYSTIVYSGFDETVEKVKKALSQQQFGVITDINMHEKLGEKLKIEMNKYKILGVCNPALAHKAIQADDNIGLFLPCKVIVKEIDEKHTEVVSINPIPVMGLVKNEQIQTIAEEVNNVLKKFMKELN